ncbi:MAG: hypothetical protein NTX45_01340 [Proteobacteria bacterium]|nr:hypothetical protein [Pseudomonadota bacterium]
MVENKVIPEKEHPIKNLIRRKKIESTKDTKSTSKSKVRSCLSCFSWTILLVGSLLETVGRNKPVHGRFRHTSDKSRRLTLPETPAKAGLFRPNNLI